MIIKSTTNPVSRRNFLKTSAVLTLGAVVATKSLASVLMEKGDITLVVSDDKVTASVPARWAIGELKTALEKQGSTVNRVQNISETKGNDFCILVSGLNSEYAEVIFKSENSKPFTEAESLCIIQSKIENKPLLFVAGADNLGLVYALTELADRINCIKSNKEALEFKTPVIERPASRTRSILRNFSSEIEDKPWFYDKGYWVAYLDMLVYSRINRLNFSTGMGYNSVQGVSDGYFLFPYPFFLNVPGYKVTAKGLPEDEQNRNFEMLKFIGEETSKRGLQFQFGIWTLAYKWEESRNTTYQIQGLTDETHAAYCSAALELILREIPGITGITFRVHYESGIRAGANDFWVKQFGAIANCGRRIEIDMHAKDIAPETLQSAIETKQPVVVSPKFCGEHSGLPYHQASIRELEREPSDNLVDTGEGLLEGNRKFSRYGYADYLSENRNWDVLYRIWPGTQRFLVSGDPALYAGYGRTASFCGATGFELCEPLHFKGRRGTGVKGGRCGYADTTLNPRYDFEKYEYFYRLWGRLGYNPDTKPEVWRRALIREFGAAARSVENALARVSGVLPLFYTAHAVSANCTVYLPEIYTNSYLAKENSWPYDTELPKIFGNISPMDPQLFQSPNECAEAYLSGTLTGKYTPVEVAQWLENMAADASENIQKARSQAGSASSKPNFRRIEEDVHILIGLAQFFAAKLRSGVAWQLFNLSGERNAGEKAIELYTNGRNSWAKMAERAKSVYKTDMSYGPRGHWIDRIPSFDEDIADLRKRLETPAKPEKTYTPLVVESALKLTTSTPARPLIKATHLPVICFQKGKPLSIQFECVENPGKVVLFFRSINQAERWKSVEMTKTGNTYESEISAEFTAKRFPLQYYFEIQTSDKEAVMYPALAVDLSNVPYFVVRKEK